MSANSLSNIIIQKIEIPQNSHSNRLIVNHSTPADTKTASFKRNVCITVPFGFYKPSYYLHYHKTFMKLNFTHTNTRKHWIGNLVFVAQLLISQQIQGHCHNNRDKHTNHTIPNIPFKYRCCLSIYTVDFNIAALSYICINTRWFVLCVKLY